MLGFNESTEPDGTEVDVEQAVVNLLKAGLEEFGDSEEERMSSLLHGVGCLAVDTLAAGDKLMVDVLPEMGWSIEAKAKNPKP